MVSEMTITCRDWQNKRPLAVFRSTPQLQKLTLDSASVHVQDLAHMHNLAKLALISCTLTIPPPSTRLSVRHLRISRMQGSNSAKVHSSVNPDIFPKLTELDLDHAREIDISWLAPQLSALQLVTQFTEFFVRRYRLDIESLRLLSLDQYESSRALPNLFRLPPFMLISDIRNHAALVQTLTYLFTTSTSKPGLKTLFAHCWVGKEEGTAAETETDQLKAQLRSKGIVVEIRPRAFSFSDAIRRMDAILLAEVKAAEEKEYARIYGE